jgi:hypothetical protein
MSAKHRDWLAAAARRTAKTVDAPDVVIDAVRRAEMDREHATLDELMACAAESKHELDEE